LAGFSTRIVRALRLARKAEVRVSIALPAKAGIHPVVDAMPDG